MKYRKFIFEDKEYTYVVGSGSIKIISPSQTPYRVSLLTFKGFSNWEVFDKGQWKGTQDGMITPREIRNFLDKVVKSDGELDLVS